RGRAPLANQLIKSRQNATPCFRKPLTSHSTAARERPSGRSGLGWHFSQTNTQKPCGYRFASVFIPISDENRDGLPVALRNFTERPAPYPASGPHSPLWWGTRVPPMRCFAASVAAAVSCPPQEKSDSGNLSGRLTLPGLGNLPHPTCLIGHSLRNQRRNTRLAAFLRTF